MWVLEARYNAEKVWYPVVWEKQKEASNVVDYDINEEITIDTNSLFNANNDTTTGMATVIPWVNAPKLIENTSIYQNSEWKTWWATLFKSVHLSYPNSDTMWIRTDWTISNEYWNIKFEWKTWPTLQWSWMEIPVAWWYEMTITYPKWWSNFKVDVVLDLLKWWFGNNVTIVNHVAAYNNTVVTETIRYHFNAGDRIAAFLTLHYTGSADAFSYNWDMTIVITKL